MPNTGTGGERPLFLIISQSHSQQSSVSLHGGGDTGMSHFESVFALLLKSILKWAFSMYFPHLVGDTQKDGCLPHS